MKQKKTRSGVTPGILAVLILLGLIFGGVVHGSEEQTDTLRVTASVQVDDLQNHWVRQYAEVLIERGILTADSDGHYKPNELATRDDLLGWIIAAWGEKQDDLITVVFEHSILEKEDLEAAANTVTRNLTAKISVRSVMNLFGETDDGFDYYTVSKQLQDYDACHSCRSVVAGAYGFGLMSGRVPGFFSGEELLSRAEAWTVVARILTPELRRYPIKQEEEASVLLIAESARYLLNKPGAVLLDVRNKNELVEAGYIPGSTLIPLAELIDTDAAALWKHKNDPIIVYCATGGRSAQACEFLRELGFTDIYDLGGIGNWTFDLEYPV